MTHKLKCLILKKDILVSTLNEWYLKKTYSWLNVLHVIQIDKLNKLL